MTKKDYSQVDFYNPNESVKDIYLSSRYADIENITSSLNHVTEYLDYDMIFNEIVSAHVSVILSDHIQEFIDAVEQKTLEPNKFYFVEQAAKNI